MSPREVARAADKAGRVTVGAEVSRIGVPVSTRTRPAPPPVIGVRLSAGVRVEQGELTPALLATLKHAASMPNPLFYERQRRRASTWDTPRFLLSFDETLAALLRWSLAMAGRPGRRPRSEPSGPGIR
jgi:hypothetical protein